MKQSLACWEEAKGQCHAHANVMHQAFTSQLCAVIFACKHLPQHAPRLTHCETFQPALLPELAASMLSRKEGSLTKHLIQHTSEEVDVQIAGAGGDEYV